MTCPVTLFASTMQQLHHLSNQFPIYHFLRSDLLSTPICKLLRRDFPHTTPATYSQRYPVAKYTLSIVVSISPYLEG